MTQRYEPIRGEFRTESECDGVDQTNLRVLYECWIRSGRDPVIALRTFEFCYSERIYPPAWVMDWIGPALRATYEQNGQVDLSDALGLSAPGRGKTNPVNQWKRTQEEASIAMAVWVLHRALHLDIPAAVECIYRRAEARGVEGLPSQNWIEDQFRRRWKKLYDQTEPPDRALDSILRIEQQYIAGFPEDVRHKVQTAINQVRSAM